MQRMHTTLWNFRRDACAIILRQLPLWPPATGQGLCPRSLCFVWRCLQNQVIHDFLRTAGQCYFFSFARSLMKGAQSPDGAVSRSSGATRRSWEVETRRGAENTKGLEDRFPQKEKGGLMLGIIWKALAEWVLSMGAICSRSLYVIRTHGTTNFWALRNEWWRQRTGMVWKR